MVGEQRASARAGCDCQKDLKYLCVNSTPPKDEQRGVDIFTEALQLESQAKYFEGGWGIHEMSTTTSFHKEMNRPDAN